MAKLGNITGMTHIVLCWLLCIILCHYGYKYYSLRGTLVFVKRRGDIVILQIVASVFILSIGFPLTDYLYWPWDYGPPIHSTSFFVLDILNETTTLAYYTQGFLLLLRYWMIHYDIVLSNAHFNYEWKNLIVQSMESITLDMWYLKHRTDLGNQSFMMKLTIGIISIVSSIIITFSLLYSPFHVTDVEWWSYLGIFIFFVNLIVFVCIWWKTPCFDDSISVYEEFKMISYVYSAALLAYTLSAAGTAIFGDQVITHSLEWMSVMIGAFALPFISTFWVLKQVEPDTLGAMNITHQAISIPTDQRKELSIILKNYDLLVLFMQHLIKEFSMECLLALIEFHQFRCHVIGCFHLELETESATSAVDTPLSKSIPKSDIVYTSGLGSDDESEDRYALCKMKAYKLYSKYIKTGTEFEINISHRSRMALSDLMSNGDSWISDDKPVKEEELATLFDPAMREMTTMLSYSATRFKYESL